MRSRVFLLVVDPLLRQLQASGMGLSVNELYAGGFLHADVIRTLATSEASLEAQVVLSLDPRPNPRGRVWGPD